MWEQKWWDSYVSVALRYKYNKIKAKRKKSVSKMYGNGCSDFINISQCESRIYFMWFDRSICCCCCCFCCCCPFNIVLPYSWVLCWDGLLFYFLTSASNKTRSFSIFLSLSLFLPCWAYMMFSVEKKVNKIRMIKRTNRSICLATSDIYL